MSRSVVRRQWGGAPTLSPPSRFLDELAHGLIGGAVTESGYWLRRRFPSWWVHQQRLQRFRFVFRVESPTGMTIGCLPPGLRDDRRPPWSSPELSRLQRGPRAKTSGSREIRTSTPGIAYCTPAFGMGTVVTVGEGTKSEASVDFGGEASSDLLLLRYAPVEKLSNPPKSHRYGFWITA